MSWGTDARDVIEADLADADIITSLTLAPRSFSGTSDGYYSSPSYTSGTSRSINAIPTNYANSKVEYAKFGHQTVGDMSFIVSSTESVALTDQVTYSSGTFNIIEINPVLVSGTSIAQAIVLKKEL